MLPTQPSTKPILEIEPTPAAPIRPWQWSIPWFICSAVVGILGVLGQVLAAKYVASTTPGATPAVANSQDWVMTLHDLVWYWGPPLSIALAFAAIYWERHGSRAKEKAWTEALERANAKIRLAIDRLSAGHTEGTSASASAQPHASRRGLVFNAQGSLVTAVAGGYTIAPGVTQPTEYSVSVHKIDVINRSSSESAHVAFEIVRLRDGKPLPMPWNVTGICNRTFGPGEPIDNLTFPPGQAHKMSLTWKLTVEQEAELRRDMGAQLAVVVTNRANPDSEPTILKLPGTVEVAL